MRKKLQNVSCKATVVLVSFTQSRLEHNLLCGKISYYLVSSLHVPKCLLISPEGFCRTMQESDKISSCRSEDKQVNTIFLIGFWKRIKETLKRNYIRNLQNEIGKYSVLSEAIILLRRCFHHKCIIDSSIEIPEHL